MELKSMKLKKSKRNKPVPIGTDSPKYPWGLRLSLDNDALEKLGIDVTKLEIKTVVPVKGMARITSISSYESVENKGKQDSVDLQIEKLALGGDLEDDDELDWEDNKANADTKLKRKGLIR
jgi:hypothetical protein